LILQLNNVTFGFSSEKQILAELTLSLEENRIYALIGNNGSGKTTIFNLITGFLKPITGEILFGEHDLTKLQSYKINQIGIGRTFQDLRIITKLTVKENIILSMRKNPTDKLMNAILPPSFHRNSVQLIKDSADKIIEEYFLVEVRNSIASEISYGQLKLLTLACCKANGATLLLLDEPVAGIQPEYCKKISILIKQLKKQGRTILIIEHNTDFISEVADQIFFLNEGRISIFDDILTLRSNPVVIDAYL
jgi:branched-chain amino acid transport system ATP-binding protein